MGIDKRLKELAHYAIAFAVIYFVLGNGTFIFDGWQIPNYVSAFFAFILTDKIAHWIFKLG